MTEPLETVRPGSPVTANVAWHGLIKCRLLWIRGDVATVEVTERRNPDFIRGATVNCPVWRLSSRKGWSKQRGIDRLYYSGPRLEFADSCFVP